MRYFMMISILFLCTLLVGDEAVTPPPLAQKEIDNFVTDVAKMRDDYATKLNVRIEKAVKSLNAIVKTIDDVNQRRAVDEEIVHIQGMKTEDAPPADKSDKTASNIQVPGATLKDKILNNVWLDVWGNSQTRLAFNKDGTVGEGSNSYKSTWELKGNELSIYTSKKELQVCFKYATEGSFIVVTKRYDDVGLFYAPQITNALKR